MSTSKINLKKQLELLQDQLLQIQKQIDEVSDNENENIVIKNNKVPIIKKKNVRQIQNIDIKIKDLLKQKRKKAIKSDADKLNKIKTQIKALRDIKKIIKKTKNTKKTNKKNINKAINVKKSKTKNTKKNTKTKQENSEIITVSNESFDYNKTYNNQELIKKNITDELNSKITLLNYEEIKDYFNSNTNLKINMTIAFEIIINCRCKKDGKYYINSDSKRITRNFTFITTGLINMSDYAVFDNILYRIAYDFSQYYIEKYMHGYGKFLNLDNYDVVELDKNVNILDVKNNHEKLSYKMLDNLKVIVFKNEGQCAIDYLKYELADYYHINKKYLCDDYLINYFKLNDLTDGITANQIIELFCNTHKLNCYIFNPYGELLI
jgi:hypothetical protein